VTELEKPDQAVPSAPQQAGAPYSKGDVLHPEWGERPPWFGYIGVGIALAAMLLGIALMILAVLYVWRWMGS
jgi:hypothetical protein